MFDNYMNIILKNAEYKLLEDGNWFASIQGIDGVWASCKTVEETRTELIEVFEEWLILKLRDNDEIPFFNDSMVSYANDNLEYV